MNRTEADRDVEVYVEQLSGLLVDVDEVVVYRPLVELEIVDPVRRLTNALTVISEARAAVDLGDRALHQMILVGAHKLATRAVGHR